MKVAVDISLYPFQEDFVPPIKDVIARLAAAPNVRVETNRLSTQIWGEYDDVMDVLNREIRTSFQKHKKLIFTIKILNNPLGE